MRRKTTAVRIGNVVLSSEEPVLVQSMLNTSTREVDACVEQAIRIIEAGGRLVRITAPGVKEAEMLGEIHRRLRERGYTTPISADIHFVAEAASVAARYVEKVRINPGNFADKRATFKKLTYTDEEYAAELEILRQKFTEFLEVCRQYGTAVRIGTNHGSLSDRIMSRYGDTPAGMVEATMEYLRVCQACDFKDVVISLKSSDCRTMVDAVRLLVEKMEAEGMCYPLHLGVTEAGEGEDGRIRSAVGIGTLLNEGIGDTIRVSLTEEPEAEIPVACELARICSEPEYLKGWTPLKGECSKPCIVAGLTGVTVLDEQVMNRIGFTVSEVNDPVYGDRLHAGIKAPEWIYTGTLGPELTKLPPDTGVICRSEELDADLTGRLRQDGKAVLVLALPVEYRLYREIFRRIQEAGLTNPAIIRAVVPGKEKERIRLVAASQLGGFFLDRLSGGLWIETPEIEDLTFPLELSRNILQSAGVRRYKAEFISCPGCGRTLFDLQGAVAKVKAAFGHLNTLKIAVMGCVVNGPGEMGDADYGYVGAGNGKVNLYKGRKMVRTAVPEEEAIGALREMIEGRS